MKKICTIILGVMSLGIGWAQPSLKPASLVEASKRSGLQFNEYQFFTSEDSRYSQEVGYREIVRTAKLLNLDMQQFERFRQGSHTTFSMRLPLTARADMEIEFVEVNPFRDDFRVVTDQHPEGVRVDLGKHYRGVVKGAEGSIAAISIFQDEIMGVFSTVEAGNFVLGKLSDADMQGENQYIFYQESELLIQNPFECGTTYRGERGYTAAEITDNDATRALSDCVGLYYETEYDMYQNKGSVQAVVNYVSGMHNQVATIYANEGINTEISEMAIWTNTDPYTSSTTSGTLGQFQAERTTFNGDLAQLLTFRSVGGGIGVVDGLCASNASWKMSFSGIYSSYPNFPTYSWTIYVITHEFGHTFGSRHTHRCVWNGNDTAIDGCGTTTEGGCPDPGNPSGGGTIMSYCHLTSVGINFSKGFGPQPGALIRSRVANANCLQPCGVVGNYPDYFPFNLQVNGSSNPTVNAGQSVTGTVMVRNQGNASGTVNSAGRFYYSNSNSFSNAQQVGSLTDLQPMAPGEEHPETVVFNIPSNASSGTRYIFFKADSDGGSDGEVYEGPDGGENNNVISIAITVGGGGNYPDYVPNTLRVNGSTFPTVSVGQSVTGTVRVKNQGNASGTVNSAGRFYYSNSNSFSSAQQVGSLTDLQPMAPGEEHPETVVFNIPSNAQAGNRYIFFKADSDGGSNGEVYEGPNGGENNNVIGMSIVVSGSPPTANFTVSNTSVCPGETLSFTNQSSGNPTSYSWSFPGGNPSSSSATHPSVTYNSSGNYSVTLIASNSSGSDTETKLNYINVSSGNCPNQYPDYVPNTLRVNGSTFPTVNVGQSVTGTVRVKNQGNASATVNSAGRFYYSNSNSFGSAEQVGSLTDLQPMAPGEEHPETVIFNIPGNAQPGNRYIFFKADSDGGSNGEVYEGPNGGEDNNVIGMLIVVSNPIPPPTPNFTTSNTNVCQGGLVFFTNQSTGNATSYSWSFSPNTVSYAGGTNSSSTHPQLQFNSAGFYTVSLTATNSSGSNTETKNAYINVSGLVTPTVSILASTNNICPGELISFSASINGGGTSPSYQWKVNGLTVSTSSIYSSNNFNNGNQVQLVITSNAACVSPNVATSNVVIVSVRVCVEPPSANFTASETLVCPGTTVQFTNQSSGNNNTYVWSFPGGTPTSSSATNPSVTYNTPGVYNVSLTATNAGGSDTESKVGYITVQTSCGPNWPVVITGDNHTVIIEGSTPITINGQLIAIGDYIGATYMEGNVEKFAGKAVWTDANISISVYGDDTGTSAKDGYTDGEVFKWKIWRAATDTEVPAAATYRPIDLFISHTNQFAKDGISSLASLVGSTSQSQTIILQPGWNMISSYIQAPNPNMSNIFAPIQSSIVLVKNGTGQVYFPSSAINTIGDWEITQGYKVKTLGSIPLNLQITGQKVNAAITPISLNTNWNLIAYLRETEQSVQTAFAPIEAQVTIVKDVLGNIYFPSVGINNIGNLRPGQGYQVKMKSGAVLNYATRLGTPTQLFHAASRVPNRYQLKQLSGNNASLILHANGQLKYGDEIGVFNTKGVLVGAAVYEDYLLALPIWGDEASTAEIEGLLEGERFQLHIWHKAIQKEVIATLSFEQGDAAYQIDGLIEARLEKTTNITIGALVGNSLMVYPNPAKDLSHLQLQLSARAEVEVSIYSLAGKALSKIPKQTLPAGRHQFDIQVSQLSVGLYYCHLLVDGQVHRIPLSVMR